MTAVGDEWWDGRGPTCRTCGRSRTKVVETRSSEGVTIRVRRCLACRSAFATVETVVGPFGTLTAFRVATKVQGD